MKGVVLMAFLCAGLAVTACSHESSPSSPTPVSSSSNSFSGVWEGRARILTCGGSMCDPRTCANIMGRGVPGRDERDIRIVFEQRDGAATAGLNLDRTSSLSTVVPLEGSVRGTVAVMTGQITVGSPPTHVVTQISDFVVTIVGSELYGSFLEEFERPGSAAGNSCLPSRDYVRLSYQLHPLVRVP